jgi:hypothetical protein
VDVMIWMRAALVAKTAIGRHLLGHTLVSARRPGAAV